MSRYRFAIAGLMALGAFINGLTWLTFAPLISQLRQLYGLTLNEATFGAVNIQNIAMIPAILLFNWMMTKVSLRTGAIFFSCLTAAGLLLRLLLKDGFTWILFGQLLAAIGSPYWSSMPPKISAIWFPDNERSQSTNLMLSAAGLSFAVGNYVPQWFVDLEADPATEATQNQIYNMLKIEAILGIIITILIILFFRSQPPTIPSASAAQDRPTLKKSIKIIATDANFILTLIAVSLLTTSGVTLQAIFEALFDELNVAVSTSATLISIGLFAGVIAGFGISYLSSKYYVFKKIILLFSILAGLSWGYLTIFGSFGSGKLSSFDVGVGIIGLLAFQMGLQPVMLEYLVEISFPALEELIGSVVVVIFLGLSNLQVYLANNQLTAKDSSGALMNLMGVQVLGLILMIFSKENLKRKEFESKEQKIAIPSKNKYDMQYDEVEMKSNSNESEGI